MANAELPPLDDDFGDSGLQSEAAAKAMRRIMHLMPNPPSSSQQSEAPSYAHKISTAEDEVILNSLTRSLRTLGITGNQNPIGLFGLPAVIGRKSKNVGPSKPDNGFTGLLISCEVDDPSFRWGGRYVTDVPVNGELPAQEIIGEATLMPIGAEAQALPCEIVDDEDDRDIWRS